MRPTTPDANPDPSPSGSALDALRHATRAAHAHLERHLAIARPDAGPDTYRDYLLDLHGWLAPFEQQLWQAQWPAEMEAAQRGGKLAWIRRDLHELGCDERALAAMPRCACPVDLTSPESRFGVAYVVEGAQLGVRVIRKALLPKLAPWSPRWLHGYGAATASRWKAFVGCLEREVRTPAARARAASAAAGCFDSLAIWFAAANRSRQASLPEATRHLLLPDTVLPAPARQDG